MKAWLLSHLTHILGYPSVALLFHSLARYEVKRIERRIKMNIPVLNQLVLLIEEIFKTDAPVIQKAVVQAATESAVTTAQQDPRVQAAESASIALLSAAKDLKSALQATPQPVVDASVPK